MGVTVYSTKTCIWCAKTKEFFKTHKIKFKDVDVGASVKAAQEMIKKSGQSGVPVIEINGTIVLGYDERRFRNLLKLKN